MKQFIYQTDKKSCEREFERFSSSEENYLDGKGKEGWELVSVISTAPMSTYDYTIYYWKREKVNE